MESEPQSAIARLNEKLSKLMNEPDSPIKQAKLRKIEGWLLEMQTALAAEDVAPEVQLKLIEDMTRRLQGLIGTEWWLDKNSAQANDSN